MLLSINMIFPINRLSLVLSNVYCHQRLVGGRGMFHFIKQQMDIRCSSMSFLVAIVHNFPSRKI